MSKDPAFLFYTSDFVMGVAFLTMQERGQYITALCLLHQHNGSLPIEKIEFVVGKLTDNVLLKFENIDGVLSNKRLSEETIKRNAFCESRQKNAKKRYTSSASAEHMNQHMENENEDVNEDIKRKAFIKPTIQEIGQYITEKGYSITAEAFHAWYESNGWKVGKNPMKDWKSAVRTWELRNKDKNPQIVKPRPTKPGFHENA